MNSSKGHECVLGTKATDESPFILIPLLMTDKAVFHKKFKYNLNQTRIMKILFYQGPT